MLSLPARSAVRAFATALVLAVGAVTAPSAPLAAADRAKVAELLRTLSLDEKLGQLTQSVVRSETDLAKQLALVRAGQVGSFILAAPPEESLHLRQVLQEAALARTPAIPLLFGYDTIHGYRTVFPIPLALGATWDADLVARTQRVAARESQAAGIDWIFTPMSDIALDPRWGRVAETFGEDVFLNSALVAASVRGLQAEGNIAATLKHFVGYGASLGGRDYHETSITRFNLRNQHLPPFHAGVRAGALTVMSAFNANDGIPAVADADNLSKVLRGEWTFPGVVVSDWRSVEEMISWGYAGSRAEAARLALTAGNDIEMVSRTYVDTLPGQVKDGAVSLAAVDAALERLLTLKFTLGAFATPQRATTTAPDAAFLRRADVALAREAATRSVVLLKNTGVLPLAAGTVRVAVIGPLADDAGEMLGSWSGWGRATDAVSLARALRDRLGADRVDVVSAVPLLESGPRTTTRTDGQIVIDDTGAQSTTGGIEAAVAAARNADLVIAALGEPRGWSGERASRAELTLTGSQAALLDAIAATGKPVVTVVFSGRPLVLDQVVARSAAVLQAWQPGIQAGPALTDLLLGVAEPTGRLTMTFPRALGQVPAPYNQAHTGRPEQRDFRDLSRLPLFPFGYGLGYTTFAFGRETVLAASADRPARVSTRVTNTGTRPGTTVVQFYLRDLACSEGARPEQELRGWQRLTLAPGESREVAFDLDAAALGFWTRDGRWVVEPGDFILAIAPQAGLPMTTVYTLGR